MLTPRKINKEIGRVDEACKEKEQVLYRVLALIPIHLHECNSAQYANMTTEQFTREQNSFVVVGPSMKSGFIHYNIIRQEKAIRDRPFTVAEVLFFSRQCRQKWGSPTTPQASEPC